GQHRSQRYIGDEEARYHTTAVAMSAIDLILKALDYKSLAEAGLSARDRGDILHSTSYWARELFRTDRAAFRRYLAKARKLDPNLAPAYPAVISAISKLIGYEAAEALADLGRVPRNFVRKFRQGLRRVAANE